MDNYTAPKPMKRLGDLFARYKKTLKAPQASIEKEALVVIEEVTTIKLSIDQINYTVSTRTLALNIPSVVKSELRLKQKNILQELETRLGRDSAPKTIL